MFIVVDAGTNRVKAAFERSPDEVRKLARRKDHTNGYAVTIGQISMAGADVTVKMQAAWTKLLDTLDPVVD